MPIIKISLLKGFSSNQKKELFDTLRTTLSDVLKVPETEFIQQILEYSSEDFDIPKTKSQKFIIIEMFMFTGRTIEIKKNIYQNIVKKLTILGFNSSDVLIIIHDPQMDNWSIRDGIAASEIRR